MAYYLQIRPEYEQNIETLSVFSLQMKEINKPMPPGNLEHATGAAAKSKVIAE